MNSGQKLASSLSRVATLNPLGDDELFGEGLDSDEDEERRDNNPKKTDTAKSKSGPGMVKLNDDQLKWLSLNKYGI